MTVLVGIPCLMTGGTEIQTLSLVKALVTAGHRVVTACYFEHSGMMVERYRAAGSEVALLSEDGKRPVGIRRMVPMLWRGLRRVVKQYRPDVAHVQYMAPGAVPIILLRMMGVRRIIATAHTSGDIYPSLRLIHRLNDWVLTAYQCITLRAEESFFGASQLFGGETKLKKHGNHFTIYNCLPDYIQVRQTPRPTPSEVITIGVVSRLEGIKGMDLVVPAFAKVHARYPQTRLLVVGDGKLREEMETQAGGRSEGTQAGGRGEDAPRSQSSAIRFVGRQPQERLQEWYDQIDILLMPSRSEGFGLTAIEGMARGCVPVVANTGGLPEVVEDGESGLLHNPEDIDDIASKVCSIVGDKDLWRRLSDASIERAERYTFDRYRESIGQLYELCNSVQDA